MCASRPPAMNPPGGGGGAVRGCAGVGSIGGVEDGIDDDTVDDTAVGFAAIATWLDGGSAVMACCAAPAD